MRYHSDISHFLLGAAFPILFTSALPHTIKNIAQILNYHKRKNKSKFATDESSVEKSLLKKQYGVFVCLNISS